MGYVRDLDWGHRIDKGQAGELALTEEEEEVLGRVPGPSASALDLALATGNLSLLELLHSYASSPVYTRCLVRGWLGWDGLLLLLLSFAFLFELLVAFLASFSCLITFLA